MRTRMLTGKCFCLRHTRALSPPQVDAFTHEAFGGNSAAVVLLENVHLPLSDSVRQAIAMEMNLSETAFLEVVDDGGAPTGTKTRTKGRYRLSAFPIAPQTFGPHLYKSEELRIPESHLL